MRFATLILALAIAPTTLFAAGSPAPIAAGVVAPLSIDFAVTAKTTIPGKSISAGHYKISIIEHLSDRVILQITNPDGKVEATFLGLINPTLATTSSTGPINWANKGTPALRGFAFPGAAPVEFVYPKSQAVVIAKSNPEKVLAVDPASDNLAVTHDRLSNQDMQIVTLWTLKSTRVGPDAQPAIEAARYHVELPQTATPTAPAYVAKVTPPNAPPAPARSRNVPSTPRVKSVAPVTAETPAPIVRKRTIAVLPHTASVLPELLLAAVLTLLGSAVLRLRRIYAI